MIITKLVKIKINTRNFTHFKNLNYQFKLGDEIAVNPGHLMENSKILINAQCSVCSGITKIEYRSYIKNTKKYPNYCCSNVCSKYKEKQTKKEIYGENYETLRVSKMKSTNKKRYGNENTSQIFRNEKNQEIFIQQLKKVYDNKFDYSKINYINNYTQVELVCKKHGAFKIRPNELLHVKQGCKKCNKEELIKIRFDKNIEKANKIHNYKYDYSNVVFENLSKKVKITCPIHGDFEQTLHLHLKGRGCSNCANIQKRLRRIELINKNLSNGYQISPSFNEKACKFFDELSQKKNIHIQHAMNGGEYYISSLGYWLDGYDIENNVAYEYDEKHHFINGELKKKDKTRQKEIIKLLKCKFVRFKE